MKKLLLFCMLALTVHISYATVLVALDENALTTRENAVITMLSNYGLTVQIVDANPDYSDLQGYDLILATESGALDATLINNLLENGHNVWMFYDAGLSLGGAWNSSSISGYRAMIVEQDEIFLDGFKSNLSVEMQGTGTAYTIQDTYPLGWTSAAHNSTSAPNYKTVLYREHDTSGAKGLIFGYNPSTLSGAGKNFADLAYQWLKDTPAYPGITVPDGHVAFAMLNYNDGTNPDLTTRENAQYTRLYEQGYEVTFVRFSRLANSDLSGASLVTGVEYPALNRHFINEQITEGRNVLLMYNSGATLGGTWNSSTISGYRAMIVGEDEIFLDGFKSNLSVEMQGTGTAFTIQDTYPLGWTSVAHNSTSAPNYKTVLYREHDTSGAKGLIFGYNPSTLSGAGENFADLAYQWLEDTPPFPGITVPDGHVAFAMLNYNDGTNPDLTTQENAHYTRLYDQGYEITFVRFSRMPNSDLSGASMITGVHYPSLNRHMVEEKLTEGIDILLMFGSGSVMGGEWNSSSISGYRNLYVEDNTTFLSGYDVDEVVLVQPSGVAYAITSNPPIGWASLGRNTSNVNNKTVLSATYPSARGLIYTYNPANFSAEGEGIWEDLTDYFSEPIVSDFYELVLQADPADIGVELTGSGHYEENETVSITATLPDGYEFLGWDGNVDDLEFLDDPYSLTTTLLMPARDVVFTATFDFEILVQSIKKDGARMFPNPFTDFLRIQGELPVEKLVVYNALGEKIMVKSGRGQTHLRVNTHNIKAGVYFVHLYFDDGTLVVKKTIKN